MNYNAMAISVRTRIIYRVLAIMTILLGIGGNTMAQTKTTTAVKNIVLVHGGFVDGSGWEGVYKNPTEKGYNVTVVQNPQIPPAVHVPVAKRATEAHGAPRIVRRHSCDR